MLQNGFVSIGGVVFISWLVPFMEQILNSKDVASDNTTSLEYS